MSKGLPRTGVYRREPMEDQTASEDGFMNPTKYVPLDTAVHSDKTTPVHMAVFFLENILASRTR